MSASRFIHFLYQNVYFDLRRNILMRCIYSMLLSFLQKEGRCLRAKRSTKATHFTFKNCTSVQVYRPRFCGLCSDGRCCTPHSTKTAQVEFQCPENKIIRRPMMFINTCVCHHHCPRDNTIYQPPASTGHRDLQL